MTAPQDWHQLALDLLEARTNEDEALRVIAERVVPVADDSTVDVVLELLAAAAGLESIWSQGYRRPIPYPLQEHALSAVAFAASVLARLAAARAYVLGREGRLSTGARFPDSA